MTEATPAAELRITNRKAFVYAIATMVISVVVAGLIGEVVLRFLPVADNPLVQPVSASAPVYHYSPDQPFLFSRDWDLHLVNRGHVNNAGMVNDQEYRKGDSTPLIAVVGDSYIDALMVPYAQTLQGRLAAALRGKVRVYSFGASGAPMSQYLIWAQYAVREFGANALVINIVGNDFDESHEAYKRDFRGFWLYRPGPDGQLQLHLNEFHVGAIRSLAKHSALARYLLVNLHIKYFLGDWRRFRGLRPAERPGDRPRYAGNTEAAADRARLDASIAAMDAFFRDLPLVTVLPPSRILFTMDGFRYPAAASAGAGTYFDLMRRAFSERAVARQYEVIDADPLFFAHFRAHHLQFQDSRDLHWNGLAHGIVAGAVLRSELLRQFGH